MYEYFQRLLDKYNVTAYKVAKETGVTTSTLTNWKKGKYTPKPEKLQKIADYFGVPLSYLLSGKMDEETRTPNTELTERDRREIGRDLDKIMNEIKNKTDGPLYYNGEAIDEHSLDLLEKALELGLTELKKENKVKYGRKKKRTEA
ncbi:helix-turn-helix domain-containing protein [Blautia sp.]|uniref:helix-turn-helix domain-containing protein n=1 Tax=Blautia sp. TaxID=1955243 RepID=UPI003AB1B1F1